MIEGNHEYCYISIRQKCPRIPGAEETDGFRDRWRDRVYERSLANPSMSRGEDLATFAHPGRSYQGTLTWLSA